MKHTMLSYVAATTLFSSPIAADTLPESFKSYYAGVPVLVTGGCGFIGSHVAETLVELGAKVTIIDNLKTGYRENIASFAHKVTFIEGDISDYQTCLQATKGNHIIFHLAAFVSVPQSIKEPDVCYATNVQGTFNLLESARQQGITRLVLSSTAAVYGPRQGICTETDPCNPISPYGTSKLIGELLCKQYADLYGIAAVALRYFNVFGPRQDPHSQYSAVVAKFSHQMAINQPITIFGDGSQTRDFVPVRQIVKANLLAGMAPHDLVAGNVFNVATGTSITLLELVAQLKQKFPAYSQEVLFVPARPGDIQHNSAALEKYRQLATACGMQTGL